jgi:hypothetical protein
MTDSGSGAAGHDPLGMSEAEKRAAEWEARHDVAARGRRGAPDTLQHYFAHERLTQDATRSHGPGAAPPQAPATSETPVQDVVPTGRRGLGRWFRRLVGRRD